MKEKHHRRENGASSTQGIRRQAEQQALERVAEDVAPYNLEEAAQWFHELRVHQIELEMQNEELRQAQLALDASRERYFDLYDLAPVGYVTVNERGAILEANLRACDMFGCSRDKLVSQHMTHFIFRDDQDLHYLHRKKLFKTGKPQAYELRIRQPDDVVIWAGVETTLVKCEENEAPTYRVVLIDITKRKLTERQLQESEARYRDLYENAPSAYFSLNIPDATIRDCNAAAGQLLGLDVAVLLGKKVLDLYADTPLGKEKAAKVLQQLVSGEEINNAELQMKRVDGSIIDINLNMDPKVDDTGTVIEGRSIATDITERKQMQTQLAQADRLATMGMLAAGVAHEINNPLTYVLHNLESLREDLPKLSAALQQCLRLVLPQLEEDERGSFMREHKELLDPLMIDDMQDRFKAALQGTLRIKNITRGLGTFSRVKQEHQAPVSLMEAIEVAVNMAFHEIKHRGRLVTEYNEVSSVMANEGKLSQVFLNLLINASHAIEKGNVENNEIRVRTWQKGGEVFAEVRDTGMGISSVHLPLLFDPFFTTKEFGVGTGLGLSISKKIIEDYHGHIEVSSEPGKGASFVVCLPAKQEDCV